jgi:hypothetical protein
MNFIRKSLLSLSLIYMIAAVGLVATASQCGISLGGADEHDDILSLIVEYHQLMPWVKYFSDIPADRKLAAKELEFLGLKMQKVYGLESAINDSELIARFYSNELSKRITYLESKFISDQILRLKDRYPLLDNLSPRELGVIKHVIYQLNLGPIAAFRQVASFAKLKESLAREWLLPNATQIEALIEVFNQKRIKPNISSVALTRILQPSFEATSVKYEYVVTGLTQKNEPFDPTQDYQCCRSTSCLLCPANLPVMMTVYNIESSDSVRHGGWAENLINIQAARAAANKNQIGLPQLPKAPESLKLYYKKSKADVTPK